MAINIIRPGGNPFVFIERRWATDDRLSYTALGILAWLCTFDPHASIDLDDVIKHTWQAPDEVKAALFDLQRYGYLIEDEAGLTLVDPFLSEPRQGDRA
jgi:hypothetical protein